MGARQILLAAAAAGALVCTLPARALASATQESILQDDEQLIYSSPDHVARELQQIAALGIDRVRVSVVWSLVTPNATSKRRPSFDASDPASYPPGAWDRYDTIVRLAAELGLKVDFQLNPPAPAWAVAKGKPTSGYSWSQDPSAPLYRQFVTAVGRRYSGSYVASVPAAEPQLSALGIPLKAPGARDPTPGQPDVIPAVHYWEIWNEPNEASWLNPVWRVARGGRRILIAPVIYRRLVDAAWSGLQSTGHAGDTMLIGETASFAAIQPGTFVEALYCVSSALRPLTGQRASELACPRSGSPSAFAAQHPGLLGMTGYAHHPYSFDVPPSKRLSDPEDVTLADLPGFERTLNRIFSTYGRLPSGGVPLYMTEWGYKTDPPNPFVKTSLNQQAIWLNQGEYLAWLDPHVRALGQFLLVDDGPKTSAPVGSHKYWGTFQTGLQYRNGARKPSFASFRLPIWLPDPRHGSRVTVWGQLRPADHTALQYAMIQVKLRGARTWRTARWVQTGSPEGFVVAHVRISSPGSVRLAWPSRTGAVYYSRTVPVS